MPETSNGEAYCENGACDVILFRTVQVNDVQTQNCPGCGQFGRLKDLIK